MKVASWTACAFLLMGTVGTSLAGPNDNGILLFHTDDSVIYTSDNEDMYCGPAFLDCPPDGGFSGNEEAPYDFENQCQDSFALFDPTSGLGASTTVGYVIAAFGPGSWPRLTGVTFGINWSTDFELTFVSWGHCGGFELATGDWPNNRFSGTAVTFQVPQVKQAVPVYWFAAYSYYGPLALELRAHPSQGGNFADDDVPSVLDPIRGYGSLGLNGAKGTAPLGIIPVRETSWGGIKAIFGRDEE